MKRNTGKIHTLNPHNDNKLRELGEIPSSFQRNLSNSFRYNQTSLVHLPTLPCFSSDCL